MNKHTPGPWSYTVDVSHTGGSDPVNMVSYRIYAQGHKRGQTHDFPCLGTLNGAGASEADAQLIAGAPDLLASAQEVSSWMDQLNTNAVTMAMRQRLRDAIAKAEGRS